MSHEQGSLGYLCRRETGLPHPATAMALCYGVSYVHRQGDVATYNNSGEGGPFIRDSVHPRGVVSTACQIGGDSVYRSTHDCTRRARKVWLVLSQNRMDDTCQRILTSNPCAAWPPRHDESMIHGALCTAYSPRKSWSITGVSQAFRRRRWKRRTSL